MSSALYLISQIIGHEGKGSLYQALKSQELILRIKACEDYQFKTLMKGMEISFNLTDKGVENYELVLSTLFAFIEMITNDL